PDGDSLPTPPSPDGRALSSLAGEAGGGYLKEKGLGATPALPLPAGGPPHPRESGQNPPPPNIIAAFTYERGGHVKSATHGRGIRTEYVLNALNQILQITHAATPSNESPAAPAFSYLEQMRYDANNNVVQQRAERRDDGAYASGAPVRWITKEMAYDL